MSSGKKPFESILFSKLYPKIHSRHERQKPIQPKCEKWFTSILNLAIVSLLAYLTMSLSVKKVLLILRNIQMAPSLSGDVVLLYTIEDFYQLPYPQWFTEICGNSCKHLSLLIEIPILSLLLQHEDKKLVFFLLQSLTLRYQSFFCFLLSFLFGSQVISHCF